MTETFPIVSGQMRALWLIIPVFVILLGAGGVMALTLHGARSARFEVSAEGLRMRGDMYGRLVPAASLRLDEARAVDLRRDRDLSPTSRTAGTAVPGYRAGWFRLRNREKALLYVTDPSRVAYIPTTEGYSVLLSVADPEELLASLRRNVDATSRAPGR